MVQRSTKFDTLLYLIYKWVYVSIFDILHDNISSQLYDKCFHDGDGEFLQDLNILCLFVINPFGAETVIFQDKKVNVMSADALALCITRSSTVVVLNMQCKWVLVSLQHLSVQKW